MNNNSIYVVMLQVDEVKQAIVATTFDYDQAATALRQFLATNPGIRTEQIFIREFVAKKDNFIIDNN